MIQSLYSNYSSFVTGCTTYVQCFNALLTLVLMLSVTVLNKS